MEEQDTQPADGMPALKITSIIVGACIILAGLAGALLFIAVKDAVEEIGEMQEEFENSHIRRKFVIDTTKDAVERSLREFVTQMRPFITPEDWQRVVGNRALQSP